MIIYDAVDVGAIPATAQAVLAYLDGGYVTLPAVRARFPHAQVLTVTTTGHSRADICDVESGDATPSIAAQGVRSGLYRTIYSATSTYGALRAALAGLAWDWFAADPTGVAHVVPGSVATQWAWPGHGSPGNFDISETNGVWPGSPAPSPAPPAPPVSSTEDNMLASTPSGNGYWVVKPDGSVYSFGDATYFGGVNPGNPTGWVFPPGVTAISIESHPGGQGYWILSSIHEVYSFGAAQFYGAP